MPRLDEDQRAAIFADGTTFDAGPWPLVLADGATREMSSEQVMRALRIVAILDGLTEEQVAALVADARVTALARPGGTNPEYWTLAKALEEVGR